ncbi:MULTISPECIES: polysaccharide pyruvyl transferase family protein [Bifidobacterium]|uniref:polysaccharide pyruvyl transferase family protein n=1 Tax=Bifidobacterium TaxID=1678 RepID=UPI001BDBF568|nr:MULTISPECIES: polysaccharide pyruvyl transferase family protein [Bifidobacterium]MBT1162618.1 polysaccharide pyruvyl transferase family protein [Bifidobacterium sp. SO1]MBW3079767.1 polysaccharide pyruvyl transferase family protein [Bifidobacterium simiiventris]
MKAAVITLHQVDNYGTQLQALATQEKLKEYFDDVTFIDYRRPDTYGKGLLDTFAQGNPVRALAILPTLLRWKSVFGTFRKNNLNLTDKVYYSEADFNDFRDDADVYFSGSDQVWNAGWNGGVIPYFYLSFVPDGKPKYAYASSFGRKTLPDDEVKSSKRYIDRFTEITVREESGVDIVKNQYGFSNVQRVVDPTLAMPPEFWRKVGNAIKNMPKEYILIYNLNRNADFDRYAERVAKKTGLPLYRFCTRYDQIFRSGKSLVIPDILDFITLVDNAKYVITDSFHATAFSMNLNTEPICVYPNAYSGRISEFLKLVNSEQMHAKDYDDLDIVNRHVDFDEVNAILEAERKKVDKFLENIVSRETVRHNYV